MAGRRLFVGLLVAGLALVAGLPGLAATEPGGIVFETGDVAQYLDSGTDQVVGATPGTGTAAPDGGTAGDIAVEGGSLAADPDRVFRRVQTMLGSDVEPPERVVVRDVNAAGLTTRGGEVVYIHPEEGDREETAEVILAHEFTHVVQQKGHQFRVTNGDESFALRSLTEGAAVYVSKAYEQQFLAGGPVDCPEAWSGPPSERFFRGPYVVGCEYAATRAGSVHDVPDLYENAPNTSEQILHNVDPGDEPPRDLSTIVMDGPNDGQGTSYDGDVSEWAVEERERLGEITVRLTLGSALPDATAVEASTGWGNDRLVTFRSDDGGDQRLQLDGRRRTGDRQPAPNGTSYAWVIRWDDARDAEEFSEAFDQYRERYRQGDVTGRPVPVQTPEREFTDLVWQSGGARFRVDRVSAETTVVFVGSRSFVDDASAFGTAGQVVVATADWQDELTDTCQGVGTGGVRTATCRSSG